MKQSIVIKVEIRKEYKNIPGVEEWVTEVEEIFNSPESMAQFNTALAIFAGAEILALAGKDGS